MNRNVLIPMLAVLLGFASSVGRADTAPSIALQQLSVDEQVTLAGVLDLHALGALAGTRTVVIDLTQAGEFAETEVTRVAALGLDYHKVPVDGAKLERDQLQQIAAILAASEDRPVLMHCASGNRAAMVWAAVQLEAGSSLEAVLGQVDPLVTHESIEGAIRAYAAGLVAPSTN